MPLTRKRSSQRTEHQSTNRPQYPRAAISSVQGTAISGNGQQPHSTRNHLSFSRHCIGLGDSTIPTVIYMFHLLSLLLCEGGFSDDTRLRQSSCSVGMDRLGYGVSKPPGTVEHHQRDDRVSSTDRRTKQDSKCSRHTATYEPAACMWWYRQSHKIDVNLR